MNRDQKTTDDTAKKIRLIFLEEMTALEREMGKISGGPGSLALSAIHKLRGGGSTETFGRENNEVHY